MKSNLYTSILNTPIGDLFAIADDTHLLASEFLHSEQLPSIIQKIEKAYNTKLSEKAEFAIFIQAQRELDEYFALNRKKFEVPLHPYGTSFQMYAWEGISRIPFHETQSYHDLAQTSGLGKAYRAIGGACHRNPLPIFIPCHRVVGSNGLLVGYGGGLERKQFLLDLEKIPNH